MSYIQTIQYVDEFVWLSDEKEPHTCRLFHPDIDQQHNNLAAICVQCGRNDYTWNSIHNKWFFYHAGMSTPIWPTRTEYIEPPILTMTIFDTIGNFSDVQL